MVARGGGFNPAEVRIGVLEQTRGAVLAFTLCAVRAAMMLPGAGSYVISEANSMPMVRMVQYDGARKGHDR